MSAPLAATFVYSNARHLFATGQLDWVTSTIKCALLNAAYAPSLSDQNLSDVPVGAIMIDATATGNGENNGICFCTIPEFDAFISGSQCVAILLYVDSGDPTTSTLIYYSADGFGFPFTPQGFNYFIGFDQAAGGFFQV